MFQLIQSILHLRRAPILPLLAAFSVLAIAGCGSSGDGDDGGTVTPMSVSVSGVAAAGAPIVGIVNVKGANGATASSSIAADGSYQLDVSALTAPYILYADGSVFGKSVTFYSAGVTAGTINITPVTDFIVSNVLQGPPAPAYAAWGTTAGNVSASALGNAETKVQAQLQPLLSAIGIPADVNLLSSAFTTDHTGIDRALEALSIAYDGTGTTATVVNQLTGSSFTDNVSTTTDDANALPAADLAAVQAVLDDAVAVAQAFEALEALYATAMPSDSDLATWGDQYVADDLLDDGANKTQLGASRDIPVGMKFAAVIEQPLLAADMGSYSKGYRVRLYFAHTQYGSGNEPTVMVYDGTNWLYWGNRRWVSLEIEAGARMTAEQGSMDISTGLMFLVNDKYDYAYNKGVRSALISGSGLPSPVVMAHLFPNTQLCIYNAASCDFYALTDNAIAIIPDNAPYTIQLCTQTAAVVAADPSQCTSPPWTDTEPIGKRPLLQTELNTSLFPVLLQPSTHNLADVTQNWASGDVTVRWTNPAAWQVSEVGLGWANESASTDVFGTTSAIVDVLGLSMPTDLAALWLEGQDIYRRNFQLIWVLRP